MTFSGTVVINFETISTAPVVVVILTLQWQFAASELHIVLISSHRNTSEIPIIPSKVVPH